MDFESLLERIASGTRVATDELLPFLCRQDRDERLQVNTRLAETFAGIGEFEQARVFVRRAWLLSGFSGDLLPLFLRIHDELADTGPIQAAYRRLGMKRAAAGDISEALDHFHSSLVAYGLHRHLDRYEYDFDILERIDRLAEPYRFRPRRPSRPGPERKIRIAYLTHLLSNPTSVFHRINLSLARFHDRSRFEAAFFVPEPESAFAGGETLRQLRDSGCRVVTLPEAGRRAENAIWLASRIHAFRPDLLVTNAALSALEGYFIACLRPAPLTVALVYGPPPQFTAPRFDWSIASARHPLMDCPGSCSFVPVEVALPGPGDPPSRPARRGDPPRDAVVLMTAGRPEKFQDRGFWKMIFETLRANPDAVHVAVGVREEQVGFLADLLPPDLRSRMEFLDWQEKYQEVLARADIVIDTFPSGGGLILMDAMAMGKPVVSFENDYLQAFDQTDWSVAMEFIPIPDLIVPRRDFEACTRTVTRLIGDEPYRRRMAERCRKAIFRTRGNPERMVRGYEKVFGEIRQRSARSAGSPAPFATGNGNLLSRLRTRLAPGLIRSLPSGYRLINRSWRWFTRTRQAPFR